jgi:hypothetical protein
MSKEKLVDFLFTGIAVVPAALLFTGQPGMAMMVFCPLLIGTCFAAVYLQDHPDRDDACDTKQPTMTPNRL